MSASALERLRGVGQVVQLASCGARELREAVRDCDALVVRTYAQVTAEVIRSAPKLRVIGRAGIGVENIDTAAARGAGVVVVHAPAASTQAVAELTIGLMIALERRVPGAEARLRAGAFIEARNELKQRQLGEMNLGIIGFGRIGQRVAGIAHAAFGMTILYNDIREITEDHVPAASLSKDEIYAGSDVISLHVPLTVATRHLIGAEAIGKMKRGVLLINTARGGVVEAGALAGALATGQVGGAAIDVFEPEPPPAGHPLLHAPNCILTPHIGSRTKTALEAMNEVVEDVIAVLEGRPPRYPYREES